RQIGVAAGSAGEDVADMVDADRAAGLLAPADEEPARLAVEIAGGEPAHPALLGRPDLRQLHQAGPQPLAVHREIAHRSLSILGTRLFQVYEPRQSLANRPHRRGPQTSDPLTDLDTRHRGRFVNHDLRALHKPVLN